MTFILHFRTSKEKLSGTPAKKSVGRKRRIAVFAPFSQRTIKMKVVNHVRLLYEGSFP
jgi:hypothetical protein